MAIDKQNLIWIDMEMTGLDPETDLVLELATIVTDANLNILAEGPVLAIHQSDGVLEGMDQWCLDTHGKSGLIKRCQESTLTVDDATKLTLAFLQAYVPKGVSPLCGNSVGQDRRFMVKYMPKLDEFFHYRIIDVSTVKELVRRWKPEVLDGVQKKGTHMALDDIRESIAEMAYYRQQVFNI